MKEKREFEGLRVMVVDDDLENLKSMGRVLNSLRIIATLVESPLGALDLMRNHSFDLVITDMKMPEMDGMEFIRKAMEISPETPFVVLTAFGSIGNAVDAIKEGASDYLQKPIDIEGLKGVIVKSIRTKGILSELTELRKHVKTGVGEIIYRSPLMDRVLRMVSTVAPTMANVLILGESGTGKELVARAIHEMSNRKENLLIPINCAALTESILESELFGHERGAFTGAVHASKGKFEIAEGGTLFLDEIGDLSLHTQGKLLRALEQKEVMRLGGERVIKVDVRIIAATNANLGVKVAEKEFREDLYYRLSVFTITIPPLRERREDIPLLISYFVKKLCDDHGFPSKKVSPYVVDVFTRYNWPGNIRQLRNSLETMVLLSGSGGISPELIPGEIRREVEGEGIPVPGKVEEEEKGEILPLEKMERKAIVEALAATGNNKAKAARFLGISVRTLYRKIKEYNIQP